MVENCKGILLLKNSAFYDKEVWTIVLRGAVSLRQLDILPIKKMFVFSMRKRNLGSMGRLP